MSNVTALPVQQSSFADEVAANIRAEAARRGVLQSEIAAALGLSQSGISGRYRGRIEWSLNEIEVVARVLRSTTSVLCAIRDSNAEPADLESLPPVIGLDAWRARRVERTAVAA